MRAKENPFWHTKILVPVSTHIMIIVLNVDYILITGSTLASISFIKIALHDAFEMSDLGLLK